MTNTPASGDIVIIHKTYNFYLVFHSTFSVLPKKERFNIGAKIENLVLEILRNLYEANTQQCTARLEILRKIDVKLKVLQLFVKALFDVRAISDQKFLQLSEKLIEIGKMLGGWIKSTRS